MKRPHGSIALALLASAPALHAQCGGCCTPQEMLPLPGQVPFPDDDDAFGTASDALGDWVVIGAPGYDGFKGAVFAYARVSGVWTLDGVLSPPSASGAARFGSSVAIGRGLVLVGAPTADVSAPGAAEGSAFVFRRDPGGWVLEQELPPNVTGFSSHGVDVDLSGTVALVGAKGEEAAYFWRRDPLACSPATWCLESKVTPPAGLNPMCYGEAVAVDGDTAFVGGSEYHVTVNAGAVFHYSYAGGNWSQFEPELVNPSFSGPGERYGETIELEGDWLMVAEPKGGGGGDGIVHAYRRNPDGTFGPSSGYEQILDDGPGATTFGRSLAMSGRDVLVGAPFTDVGGATFVGTAYRYRLTSGVWTLYDTYLPCGLLTDFDRFGWSVGLGNHPVVGANGDDHSGFLEVGSAWIFD